MVFTADEGGNWDDLLKHLEKRLQKRRFQHSVRVSQTASALAENHSCDPYLAAVAGLLHDYARDIKGNDLLILAERFNLAVDPIERQVPVLLHGPVGAMLIKQELGISHKEILEAVAWHTTGAPGMSDVAGIIYLADIIEPQRDFPSVAGLRKLAELDLHTAILAGLEGGIRHCIETGHVIHPRAVEARNHLVNKISSIENECQ